MIALHSLVLVGVSPNGQYCPCTWLFLPPPSPKRHLLSSSAQHKAPTLGSYRQQSTYSGLLHSMGHLLFALYSTGHLLWALTASLGLRQGCA